MRAPALIISLVQWRWTPSVVLVAGSLAFVGIVVLIVPDDLGSVASGADRLSRAARQGVPKKLAAPSDESLRPSMDDEPSAISPQRPAALPPRTGPANNIVQSIFHPTPKTELPVEPVDPNPPPPPPPPPLPPPTTTTYTLENPPPAPPPAPAPVEPQDITGQGTTGQ